MYTSKYKI
ncbi:hypothetical protein [Plasmodium yoelii yoelii]|uniref:Uncharacterized protein n=1 Tax=Plasmodium yoelii yoelii TaxID=73239 RepID=Q7RHY0_PLAYO|nr:hypothetical protein [Plasmodium yoelii yoelii]